MRIISILFNGYIVVGIIFICFIGYATERPICHLGPSWNQVKYLEEYPLLKMTAEAVQQVEPGLLILPLWIHGLVCLMAYVIAPLHLLIGISLLGDWQLFYIPNLIISSITFFMAILPSLFQIIIPERTDYPILDWSRSLMLNFIHLSTPLAIIIKMTLSIQKNRKSQKQD